MNSLINKESLTDGFAPLKTIACPDSNGHFGIYGGRYVGETLMPAILELEE
ncbi:MAG: tryptophan synthase subunit beta, partial [Desulfobacterium sp.]|nr:tryptophan synthase subunit beta [Desulfobacterium sp.]